MRQKYRRMHDIISVSPSMSEQVVLMLLCNEQHVTVLSAVCQLADAFHVCLPADLI